MQFRTDSAIARPKSRLDCIVVTLEADRAGMLRIQLGDNA